MQLILTFVFLLTLAACGNANDDNNDEASSPAVQADADELAMLNEAIQDEYRAQFTYQKVVSTFGNVQPFTNILQAEIQHANEITALYQARGLSAPASIWNLNNVPSYGSVQEACAAGVTGEVGNVAMYDRFLALDLDADIRIVFENLRAASQNQHLPAFQQCTN